MDVGHLRNIRWVKDDNPNSPINNKPELTANGKSAAQNRWIAYNKMRGQYASAMEHAVPEQYWVDKTKCRYVDQQGAEHNPALADCAQGISAVKDIAIAQSQGQKIYTINQSNRDTALPKLTIGGDTGAEIRNAINAGKEVTFHESSINANGWTGYGYIITDTETGAGAYIIEGSGNGGVLLFQSMAALFSLIQMLSIAKYAGWLNILPVIININPYLKLAVAFLALVGAFSSDDPYVQDATSINLQIILSIVGIGLISAAASPIIFAITYIALVVFVSSLIGQIAMLFFSKKSEGMRYA